jgi:hypothetical protein
MESTLKPVYYRQALNTIKVERTQDQAVYIYNYIVVLLFEERLSHSYSAAMICTHSSIVAFAYSVSKARETMLSVYSCSSVLLARL